MHADRPDPDVLLQKIQQDEARQKRGKLKIFFGSCAGVGKTYAMLQAAHARVRDGDDVVIGVIETHGRSDTEAQLRTLPQIPMKSMDYRGKTVKEFDLDAALQRRPTLILVDELAHSNIEGSRHRKRWQDVEELLSSGIDVYTTLNVQHLESLNDVVGQITGIRVAETLPDKVFDLADEVTLVDLSPDDLLQRLEEGKVYVPIQAEKARKNFFRKGNLIALREMALRRTADRVDAQMREYRTDQSISQVWQANERILVGIGPGHASENLIRTAARLAANMKVEWIAVYVETPELQTLNQADRKLIMDNLRLAQTLGASTASLSGDNICQVLLEYARNRNVSRLVVGKARRPLFMRLLRPSVTDDLANQPSDIDIHIVMRTPPERVKPGIKHRSDLRTSNHFSDLKQRGYMWAIAISVATSIVAALLLQVFDLSNVIMLYLLGVMLISVRYGRGPGILASLLSVSAFDFFFVPPKLSFTVSDTQYLLTFAIMLSVALVISNLTASLRRQAVIASYRERRSLTLYEMGKELASAMTTSHIAEVTVHHLSPLFQAKVAILLPDHNDQLSGVQAIEHIMTEAQPGGQLNEVDLGIAQWTYDHQEQAGLGTDTLPSSKILYVPLKAPMRTRGVLAIAPESASEIFLPEQRQLLDTFAAQIGLTLERKHYVEVARDALITMESERLRNSLLSAISHDLRTPLTSLIGIASNLKTLLRPEDPKYALIEALYDQAYRMQNLVVNLLDMARLQSGKVQLNSQWQMLEEVIGTALHSMQPVLGKHHVEVNLPSDLPLIKFDSVLIERVFCNLLDNAAKYTDEGTRIVISAQRKADEIWVSVKDDGPGLPEHAESRMFEKFTRGERESAKPGVGLGLSICQAIIQAHGGAIWVERHIPHGAIFTFSLPIGMPPELPGNEE
jgi:two-component system sensor histidine kinase KdpD